MKPRFEIDDFYKNLAPVHASEQSLPAVPAGSLPTRIMYVPGGISEIGCGLGDVASCHVWVSVGPECAAVLDASLRLLNQVHKPQRALFDFEHQGKEAMCWPISFSWSDSPAPGVYANVEFSSLGKEYVLGKVVRAFSGSFFSDAKLPNRKAVISGKQYVPKPGDRGSQENPCHIIGLDFPYAGTLTNNPAFRSNLPMWAKRVEKSDSVVHKAGVQIRYVNGAPRVLYSGQRVVRLMSGHELII